MCVCVCVSVCVCGREKEIVYVFVGERQTERRKDRQSERERQTERRTVKLQNLQTEQHTVCEFVERERERERDAGEREREIHPVLTMTPDTTESLVSQSAATDPTAETLVETEQEALTTTLQTLVHGEVCRGPSVTGSSL